LSQTFTHSHLPCTFVLLWFFHCTPEMADTTTLTVRCVSASNLQNRDLMGDISDPYVLVKVGKESKQTKAIKNNLNPVWNETFTFKIAKTVTKIRFDIWDENYGKDKLLGALEIPIAGLPYGPQSTTAKLIEAKQGEITYEAYVEAPVITAAETAAKKAETQAEAAAQKVETAAQDAAKKVGTAAQDAAKKAEIAAEDVMKKAQDAAKKTEAAAEDAMKKAQASAQSAAQSAQTAVLNAENTVINAVDSASPRTKSTLFIGVAAVAVVAVVVTGFMFVRGSASKAAE